MPQGSSAPVSKGMMNAARRLLLGYVAVIVGPLAIAAVAFALRDRLTRRRQPPSGGNGHAEAEALDHMVTEVRATS